MNMCDIAPCRVLDLWISGGSKETGFGEEGGWLWRHVWGEVWHGDDHGRILERDVSDVAGNRFLEED
jgi:hypothetical protein